MRYDFWIQSVSHDYDNLVLNTSVQYRRTYAVCVICRNNASLQCHTCQGVLSYGDVMINKSIIIAAILVLIESINKNYLILQINIKSKG